MAHALSLGEEGGYITLFTLEGQPMADLIRKAVKTKDLPYQFSFAYSKRVLEHFPETEVASQKTAPKP